MYSVIPRMDKLKEFFLSRGGLLSATSATVEAFKDVLPGYSTDVFQSGLRVAELMLPTNDSKENINKAREVLSKLSETALFPYTLQTDMGFKPVFLKSVMVLGQTICILYYPVTPQPCVEVD